MPHRAGATPAPWKTGRPGRYGPASLIAMLLFASLAASGCLDATSGPSDPDVITTAYPLTFIAKRIAGDDVDIRTVHPQSERPFGWEPGPQDKQLLSNARLLLHTGGVIDPWATARINPPGQGQGDALDVTRGIGLPEAVHLHSVLRGAGWERHDGHGHGHDDGGPSPSQVLTTGDEYTHTFTAGSIDALPSSAATGDEEQGERTIGYRCHLHPWKEGTIRVLNGTAPDGPVVHEVSIIDQGTEDLEDMYFDPPVVEIHEGDTIRWVNHGSLQHTITLGEGEDPGEHPEEPEARTTHVDPHFWTDPVRTMTAVNNTLEALVAMNPDQEDTYRARAEELNAGLKGLHERYRYGLRQCETRHMFLTEEAFGGISHRYNLYQHPLRTLETPTENPLSNVQGVAHLMRNLQATHIFAADPADATLARVLSMETAAHVLPLDTLRSPHPERLADGETYFSIMGDNLETLRLGLRCL